RQNCRTFDAPRIINYAAMTTEHQLIDPVCHMTVDPKSSAGSFEYKDHTYYFCCKHCLKKFSENPRQFLEPNLSPITIQPVSLTRSRDKSIYTCPMHPEVSHAGHGTCSKCGMALEKESVELPQRTTEYTCTMHPELLRSQAGSYRICLTALEPPEVELSEDYNPELVDMR